MTEKTIHVNLVQPGANRTFANVAVAGDFVCREPEGVKTATEDDAGDALDKCLAVRERARFIGPSVRNRQNARAA